AGGGYDDLVERSRRNLGLDKPLILNFRFDDRTTMAHRAIDDLFRRAEDWQKDGERRLGRVSTIALGPALERYAAIGTENERPIRDSAGREVDVASPEERRERLATMLPRLAAESPQFPSGTPPD